MLLVDTNVWLSAADQRSQRHRDSVALLTAHEHELAAPAPVIAESAWLILDRLGTTAHNRFLALVGSREIEPIDLTESDWQRIGELCRQYDDLRLDAVDASLVAVAERLKLDAIATYNHRDFAVVRPGHVEALTLLP